MTRTSFTSYYSLLFVIFICHHVSQNCSRLGEVGAWEHFVYHAKGINVISVIGHNLPQGLNLVHISKTLGRKWFFPCFSFIHSFIHSFFPCFSFIHATFFTVIIIVIISLVTPLCLSIFTFSLHFFPNFYFLITWLVICVLSYILLLIVSKDVHTIAKIA